MAVSVPWKELVPLHQTHLSLGHDWNSYATSDQNPFQYIDDSLLNNE